MGFLNGFSEESETKGMAIAGMSLAGALISTLRRKGIFTDEDVKQIHEAVLLSLEQIPDATDQGVCAARVLLDGMVQTWADLQKSKRG